MKIQVDTRALESAARTLGATSKQIRYATARALTQTAKAVQREMPEQARKDLSEPTSFTVSKNSMFVTPATKLNLSSTVGYKERQSSYLQWQVEGGRRTPKGIEKLLKGIGAMPASGYISVPGHGAPLDANGNIRRTVWREVIGSLRTQMSSYKGRGKKMVKVGYFSVMPGASRLLPGIYLRGAGQIKSLLIFVPVAKYRPRFEFEKRAETVIKKEFEPLFEAALADALATAKP